MAAHRLACASVWLRRAEDAVARAALTKDFQTAQRTKFRIMRNAKVAMMHPLMMKDAMNIPR
jgi:hypothetical protein